MSFSFSLLCDLDALRRVDDLRGPWRSGEWPPVPVKIACDRIQFSLAGTSVGWHMDDPDEPPNTP